MGNINTKLKTLLREAVGKQCWYVTVGGRTLPQFTIDLGNKIKRIEPLKNMALPKFARIYEGEVSFFIRSSWRLEHGNAVIATCNDNERQITNSLDQLLGQSLEQIRVEKPAWDLSLVFSKQWRLQVFADCGTHGYQMLRNWHCSIGKNDIYAGPGEKIQAVKREGGIVGVKL